MKVYKEETKNVLLIYFSNLDMLMVLYVSFQTYRLCVRSVAYMWHRAIRMAQEVALVHLGIMSYVFPWPCGSASVLKHGYIGCLGGSVG